MKEKENIGKKNLHENSVKEEKRKKKEILIEILNLVGKSE